LAHELSSQIAARAVYSRSMQYFWQVARTGSIREASRNLNVAPSAVSRQIAQLQERLDVRLFYNLGNALRLSPAGEVLAGFCETNFAALESTVGEIGALQGDHAGLVRIVSVGSFANTLLAEMIEGFSARHPAIRLEAAVCSAAEVAERVQAGEADLGFTFGIRDDEALETVFAAHCPTRVVVARQHPLAARPVIAFADCLDYPIGLLNPSTIVRRELEIASTRANVPWPRCFVTNSITLLEDLAAAGRYVTYQPDYGFAAARTRPGLVSIPMQSRPPGIKEEFVLVADRRIQPAPAAREFRRFAAALLNARRAEARPAGAAAPG
jgi:DNA-binding transcriptional LysR family regulator